MLMSKKIRTVLFLVIFTIIPFCTGMGRLGNCVGISTMDVKYAEIIDYLNDNSESGITRLDLYLQHRWSDFDTRKRLFAAIQKNEKITSLTIEFMFNNFKDTDMKALSEMIKNLSNLKSLKLGLAACNLDDSGIAILINAISQCKKLEEVSVDLQAIISNREWSNNIGDDSIKALSKMINGNNAIKKIKLVLCENFINVKSIDDLIESIKQTKIKEIELNLAYAYITCINKDKSKDKYFSLVNAFLNNLNIKRFKLNFRLEQLDSSIKTIYFTEKSRNINKDLLKKETNETEDDTKDKLIIIQKKIDETKKLIKDLKEQRKKIENENTKSILSNKIEYLKNIKNNLKKSLN